jgi:hypothetical protein
MYNNIYFENGKIGEEASSWVKVKAEGKVIQKKAHARMGARLYFATLLAVLAVIVVIASLASNIIAPSSSTTHGDGSVPPMLNEEQKREAISVTLSDPLVGNILAKSNWTLFEAGPWTESGRIVGAIMLIRLERPVWVSGEFKDIGGKNYRAKLWVGNLHVLVDLSARRVVAVSPGMARPPEDPPEAETYEALRAVAEKKLGTRPLLAGLFYTDEYPAGLAFFMATVGDRERIVAVDVARGIVVDKYSGEVIKP